MVEDRTTDPTRIAQLLASELTGLETGPLAAVAVTDADRDAEPSSEGVVAYHVTHADERVGRVVLFPDRVDFLLTVRDALPSEPALPVETTDEGVRIRIESGSAVKRAVDVLRDALEGGESA